MKLHFSDSCLFVFPLSAEVPNESIMKLLLCAFASVVTQLNEQQAEVQETGSKLLSQAPENHSQTVIVRAPWSMKGMHGIFLFALLIKFLVAVKSIKRWHYMKKMGGSLKIKFSRQAADKSPFTIFHIICYLNFTLCHIFHFKIFYSWSYQVVMYFNPLIMLSFK